MSARWERLVEERLLAHSNITGVGSREPVHYCCSAFRETKVVGFRFAAVRRRPPSLLPTPKRTC